MKIVTKSISLNEIREMARCLFGDMVKAVVDVKKIIMAVDAELHADEEAALIAEGSRQEDLWGINLYPEHQGDDFIEFDSMINIKPSSGNRSRSVSDPKIRENITSIVNRMVKR